jgi:hypothetical protein
VSGPDFDRLDRDLAAELDPARRAGLLRTGLQLALDVGDRARARRYRKLGATEAPTPRIGLDDRGRLRGL